MKNISIKTSLLLIGLFVNLNMHAEVFDGHVLFTPLNSAEEGATTYLMNNDFETLQSWSHEQGPASMPYLLEDGSIIYPYRVPFPSMEAGGVGGGIQCQTWDGNIIWEYTFADQIYQHHHDVEPLPNGNVLIIVWEKKTAQEAYDMGRVTISNPLNQIWSTAILELEPLSGEIRWEWHLWDHLIQDVNSDFPNHGVISEHPELKIALLHIDVDIFEPTETILKNLYNRVVKGGLVVFDDYALIDGETEAIDQYFDKQEVLFEKYTFLEKPTYIRK